MYYNNFSDLSLSALGLGCMRLPTKNGNNSEIDEELTAEMIDTAIKSGINYFDTAFGYHGGNSESVVGKILQDYPRKSFYLASKFPGYDNSNFGKTDEIFEKQLEKCRVDYFDFYLFHNVCELNIDNYLNEEKFGTYSYLMEQKERGRIRHLGFSCHGDIDVLQKFLDAYGKDMEFCQLQINWLDWEFQKAKEKVDLLNFWQIPVWVMEPLRGGKLVNLSPKYDSILKRSGNNFSNPEWAFRFLQGIDSVKMILSGMSDLEQLKENIEIFSEQKPLSDADDKLLREVARDMTSYSSLPCTACKYCVSECPQSINIPKIIELYNEYNFSGGGFLPLFAINAMDEDKRPSACLGCKNCEAVCPQKIKISQMMKSFAKKLDAKG